MYFLLNIYTWYILASWAASFSFKAPFPSVTWRAGEEGSGPGPCGSSRGSRNCQTWRISALTSLQPVNQSRHPALWVEARQARGRTRLETWEGESTRPGEQLSRVEPWYWSAPPISYTLSKAFASEILLTTVSNASNVFGFSIIISFSCSRARLTPPRAPPQASSKP